MNRNNNKTRNLLLKGQHYQALNMKILIDSHGCFQDKGKFDHFYSWDVWEMWLFLVQLRRIDINI